MGAMPLKLVGGYEEEQYVPSQRFTLVGERAAKVRKQASHFPQREKLVVPDWNGRFDLFQVPSKVPEYFCTGSADRYRFLEVFYQYPTAVVVEVKHGEAQSAPREAVLDAVQYIFDHTEDFEPMYGGGLDLDALGDALGALAYRTSGPLHPCMMDSVETFEKFDEEGTFFYISQADPNLWAYLGEHWLDGSMMIDSDVEIPEFIHRKLKPVMAEIRLAGSDAVPIAYMT